MWKWRRVTREEIGGKRDSSALEGRGTHIPKKNSKGSQIEEKRLYYGDWREFQALSGRGVKT